MQAAPAGLEQFNFGAACSCRERDCLCGRLEEGNAQVMPGVRDQWVCDSNKEEYHRLSHVVTELNAHSASVPEPEGGA